MRTFKFTLLVMISYIAMVGATRRMHRASGPIDRRQDLEYVPLTTARGVFDAIEIVSPA